MEAPFIWCCNGKYYLFYSANSYADGSYALGYAVAGSLDGPYVKTPGPWQRTTHPTSNGGHVRRGSSAHHDERVLSSIRVRRATSIACHRERCLGRMHQL